LPDPTAVDANMRIRIKGPWSSDSRTSDDGPQARPAERTEHPADALRRASEPLRGAGTKKGPRDGPGAPRKVMQPAQPSVAPTTDTELNVAR
jgi:hypothetical protein